jgi:hypothetical protein
MPWRSPNKKGYQTEAKVITGATIEAWGSGINRGILEYATDCTVKSYTLIEGNKVNFLNIDVEANDNTNLVMNAFNERTICSFIGTSIPEYMEIKEKSTGDEDSLDPIAEFLDRAHEKEGVVAYMSKQSTLH